MTKRETFENMLDAAGWVVVEGPYARSTTVYEKPGRRYAHSGGSNSGKPIRVYLGVKGMLRVGPTRQRSCDFAHVSPMRLLDWFKIEAKEVN